jgi:hypothetical protein
MHSMGSGKTITGLMLAQNFMLPIIIVTPPGQDVTWKNEAGKMRLTSNPMKFMTYPDVEYKIKNATDLRWSNSLVIFDEAHHLLRLPAQVSLPVFSGSQAPKRAFFFTGTPVIDNISNLGFFIAAASGGSIRNMPLNESTFLKEFGTVSVQHTVSLYGNVVTQALFGLYTIPTLLGLKTIIGSVKVTSHKTNVDKSLKMLPIIRELKNVLPVGGLSNPVTEKLDLILTDVLALIARQTPGPGQFLDSVAKQLIILRRDFITLPVAATAKSVVDMLLKGSTQIPYLQKQIKKLIMPSGEADVVLPSINPTNASLHVSSGLLNPIDIVYMLMFVIIAKLILMFPMILSNTFVRKFNAEKFLKLAGPYIDSYDYRSDSSALIHYPVGSITTVPLPYTKDQQLIDFKFSSGTLSRMETVALGITSHLPNTGTAELLSLYLEKGRSIGSLNKDHLKITSTSGRLPEFKRVSHGWTCEFKSTIECPITFECPMFQEVLRRLKIITKNHLLKRCVIYSSFEWVSKELSIYLKGMKVNCRYMNLGEANTGILSWINDVSSDAWREERVLILHPGFIEGININAPSGLIIMEPLSNSAAQMQIRARILRFCPYNIQLKDRPIVEIHNVVSSAVEQFKNHYNAWIPQEKLPWDSSYLISKLLSTASEQALFKINSLNSVLIDMQDKLNSSSGIRECNTKDDCEIWEDPNNVGTCRKLDLNDML